MGPSEFKSEVKEVRKEQVIGQILAAQSIIYALPTAQILGEFALEVVRTVPGVKSAGLCFKGFLHPIQDSVKTCEDCSSLNHLGDDKSPFKCGFAGKEGIWVLPLKTAIQVYGFYQIGIENPIQFEDYKPIIKNFANVIAITLENSWQRQNLEAANAELMNHRENLQCLVEERTKDINAQKEQLKAYAEELELVNEELRDFVHIASHDLQEPLRRVSNFGGLLKEQSKNFDQKSLGYLNRMQNSTKRMHDLLDDLRTYSKLISSKRKCFESVDLEMTIRQTLVDLEILLKETGGRVEIGSLATIEADRFQMGELFQNLISNSLNYRKKGSHPFIKIQGQNSSSANGLYKIWVEDNGIGFEEKYKDRIFKPYERLNNKSEHQGTGIGLTICKKIVERHGGCIEVSSKVNKGTTFTIKLPLKQTKKFSHKL